MRGLTRQYAILFSVAVMLLTNLVFGSRDNSIYDTFPTTFTPAPYTFVVWGPIFLGCLAFAIYQFLPKQRDDTRLDALGWPMVLAFISNGLTAYPPIGLSNIVIIVVLLALLWAFAVLTKIEPQDRTFFWLVRVPIVIFFSWLTVATILNTCQWLVSIGWTGFAIPGAIWATLLIGIATLIGLYIVLRFKDAAYGLVLLWAFWGIVARQQTTILLITTILVSVVLLSAIVATTRFTQDNSVQLRPNRL